MRTRETVAWVINKCSTASVTHHQFADEILSALHAAGYRLLAPGELVRETIERCAAECDRIDNECGMEAGLASSCAAALRSLNGGSDHG